MQPDMLRPLCGTSNDSFPKFTFGDAVSDLEYIESGEQSSTDKYHKATNHPEHVIRWLYNVPQGKSAHDNEDPSLRPPSGYNTTYKRQVWSEPGCTVTTNFNMISGGNNVHPIATRALTISEALRLQSFPDSFKFTGKDGTIRTTIGNAVPPLLAYNVAKFLKEAYITKKQK
jgi:DNA (cytosine-5)-methyltransferase 1